MLARCGLGDRAAFAALYQATSAHLFAVVLRINRDRAQAEDVLQEVYVKVWRAARIDGCSHSFGPQLCPIYWTSPSTSRCRMG